MNSGSRRWTLRDALVVAQTAVTLVLLVAAGLLTRSILKAQQVDLGFAPAGLAVLGTEVGLIGYDEAKARCSSTIAPSSASGRCRACSRSPARCASRSRSTTTGTASSFPDRQSARRSRDCPPAPRGWTTRTSQRSAFRCCTAATSAPRIRPSTPKVAIVNESFVRRHWPGEDALGRRFRTQAIDGPEYQVVGVVADYKVDTVGEAADAVHPLRPRAASVHGPGPDRADGR